jgi:hypothetical protein
MGLGFEVVWLLVAAILLVLGAVAIGLWRHQAAPVLFVLGGAAFALAGARPVLQEAQGEVVHAVVMDVSASMEARMEAARSHLDAELGRVELPAGHSFERLELSDALRLPHSPAGKHSDYQALAGLPGNINGEVLLVTDGRGDPAGLLRAVSPRRLTVLRPPAPESPDAAILDFKVPTAVAPGGSAYLQATLFSDLDADVPWRMYDGTREIASGSKRLRGGLPGGITQSWRPDREGLIRVRLVLDLSGDREARNDEASVAFYAGRRLIVQYCVPEDFPQEADALYARLSANESLDVQVRHSLPATLRELDGTGLLVINDLPLHRSGLTRGGLEHIARWVQAGGSLLMLGTEGAFGPGGYRGTPLERIAPVRFRPDDAPPRHTLLLLDISDSMAELLPDGVMKLQRLVEGAALLLEASGEDHVALAAFNERLRHEPAFQPATSPRHLETLAGLRAHGSTNIHLALHEGLMALQQRAPDDADRRVFLITDGEDLGGERAASWRSLASEFAHADVRLDVVLTEAEDWDWLTWMREASPAPDIHVWSVGDAGFAAVLETVERAIGSADDRWVSTERWEVPGSEDRLHLLTRTAPRTTSDVDTLLEAIWPGTGEPSYPLLARRTLVGRTAAICTRSWGDERQVAFWQNSYITDRMQRHVLDFLLEGANRDSLVLNMLDEGAELVWVGAGVPPQGDLRTADGVPLRRFGEDRWLLAELPEGDELQVFSRDVLIQRIALPQRVPSWIAPTGDDEIVLHNLERSGVRVLSGLGTWQPAVFEPEQRRRFELLWLPALIGVLLVVSGFALRRR